MSSSVYDLFLLILKLIVLSYVFGMIWCIVLRFKKDLGSSNNDEENFFDMFGVDIYTESSKFDSMITFVYFSFTTISTVGFGDYYPANSFERLSMCSVLIYLIASQSFVLQLMGDVIHIFISLG